MHSKLQRVKVFRLCIFPRDKPDELSGILTVTVNNQRWESTVVNGLSEKASLMNLNRELETVTGKLRIYEHLLLVPWTSI